MRGQFGGRNDLASAEVGEGAEGPRRQGAVLIDIPEMPNAGKYGNTELEVLLTELKADLAAYLQEWAPDAPVKNLADIIAFNEEHKDKVMPFFGQEHFVNAQKKGGLDSKEYLDALASNQKLSRAEGIDKLLTENKLDALVAPTGGPAWLTDFVKGDASGGGFTQPAAVAGYPHVTVPAGFVQGLPCGISFVGTAWSEARLIALAYAYEQASRARKPPPTRRRSTPGREVAREFRQGPLSRRSHPGDRRSRAGTRATRLPIPSSATRRETAPGFALCGPRPRAGGPACR